MPLEEKYLRLARQRSREDPVFRAIAMAIAKELEDLEAFFFALFHVFSLRHDQTPLSILKVIGAILSVDYQPGWSKQTYAMILRARIRSRRSAGTFDDVKSVANALRKTGAGDQAGVTILHPEALQINIPGIGTSAGVVLGILKSAIQETTSLTLTTSNDSGGGDDQYIRFGVPGQGFGKRLSESLGGI